MPSRCAFLCFDNDVIGNHCFLVHNLVLTVRTDGEDLLNTEKRILLLRLHELQPRDTPVDVRLSLSCLKHFGFVEAVGASLAHEAGRPSINRVGIGRRRAVKNGGVSRWAQSSGRGIVTRRWCGGRLSQRRNCAACRGGCGGLGKGSTHGGWVRRRDVAREQKAKNRNEREPRKYQPSLHNDLLGPTWECTERGRDTPSHAAPEGRPAPEANMKPKGAPNGRVLHWLACFVRGWRISGAALPAMTQDLLSQFSSVPKLLSKRTLVGNLPNGYRIRCHAGRYTLCGDRKQGSRPVEPRPEPKWESLVLGKFPFRVALGDNECVR